MELIQQLKHRYSLQSKYAVAKKLGVNWNTLHGWYKGRSAMGDEAAMRAADLLEIDAAYVLVSMHAERAQKTVSANVWRDAAQRLAS